MEQDSKSGFLGVFLKGEFYFGFWRIMQKVVNLGNTFLVIALLSLKDYGVYSLVIAFFNIVNNLIPTFDNVILNDIIRLRNEDNPGQAKKLYLEFVIWKLTAGFLCFLAVFLGAGLIAAKYDPGTANLFRIIAFLFLVTAAYDAMKMLFQANLRFNIVASRATWQSFFRLIFLLAFLRFGGLDTAKVLIALVLSSLAAALLFWPRFARELAAMDKAEKTTEAMMWPILKKYGKWDAFIPLLNNFSSNVRPWLIKLFLSTEAVAIYSVANSLVVNLSIFLPTSTLSSLIPRAIADKEKTRRVFFYGIKYLTLLSLVVILASWLLAGPFVRLLFPQYVSSLSYFRIMALALIFTPLITLLNNFIIALRDQKFLFVRLVQTAVVDLLILISLLYSFGMYGLTVEYVLIAGIACLINYFFLAKKNSNFRLAAGELFQIDANDKEYFLNTHRGLKRVVGKYFKKLKNN